MKLKPVLTREQIFLIWDVDFDTGLLRWATGGKGIKKGAVAGSLRGDGYVDVGVTVGGKRFRNLVHTLIWIASGNGYPAAREDIHHLNEIKSDNRLINLELRYVRDHTFNHKGRPFDMRNIYWFSREKRWQVQFHIDGKLKYFGQVESLDEAKQVRNDIEALLIAAGEIHPIINDEEDA